MPSAQAREPSVSNGSANPPAYSRTYSNENPSVLPNHFEGNSMNFSRTIIARTDLGNITPNSSDADVIFIKEWAQRYTAKEGAELTGMTPKGFQKIQLGENTISYKKMTQWMKRDHDLAAAYFYHVGLLKAGEAETAAAYTKFANAAVRLRG